MEWVAINDFPNYVINSSGIVKNINTGKPISVWKDTRGYNNVTLWKMNKSYPKKLCRLVAAAFCDGWFEGAEVNHKDEVITNDNAENLEWCTHIYNMNYGTRTKRAAEKLSIPVVAFNDGKETFFNSLHEAASYFCGSPANICACLKGRTKSAYGFSWRYA